MTGTRRGEVLGRRWKDLYSAGVRISVRQALVAVAYKIITSTPQNHHARVIDLDEGTVSQIRAHRQRQQIDRDEWGTDYQENDLLFCKEDGSPVHPHTFSQAFERLVAKMGPPTVRLHDLRHTHATIALKAGIPVKFISERLGHENPAFTMKQHAHVIPGISRGSTYRRETNRSHKRESTGRPVTPDAHDDSDGYCSNMTCRDEILTTFNLLARRTGRNTFSPAEILSEMRRSGTTYADSTIRTHVISRMCANAADHHAVVYKDLERVDTGSYRRLG